MEWRWSWELSWSLAILLSDVRWGVQVKLPFYVLSLTESGLKIKTMKFPTHASCQGKQNPDGIFARGGRISSDLVNIWLFIPPCTQSGFVFAICVRALPNYSPHSWDDLFFLVRGQRIKGYLLKSPKLLVVLYFCLFGLQNWGQVVSARVDNSVEHSEGVF